MSVSRCAVRLVLKIKIIGFNPQFSNKHDDELAFKTHLLSYNC